MAETKTLQTRIALKHDTWAAWHDDTKEGLGANLVLLKGEIGICEIPSGHAEATTAPTMLFKVGDGTTPFKTLKWASALAADVYSWAKASNVVLEDKTIRFVGAKNEDGSDKVIALNYATPEEVSAITNPLTERIAAVEAKFSGDASVEGQIAGLKDRLDVIEGSGEGSVAKAEADAKAYTDEREVVIKAYADQAEADAIAAAETASENKVSVERARIDTLESEKSRLEGLIGDNADAITGEAEARGNADNAINAKIGEGFDAENTVAVKVKAAQDAADAAQADIDALVAEDGQITVNTAAIAENKADIAENAQAIADEKSARESADEGLDARLQAVEAFFEAADHDGEGQDGLHDALDTLVEIQKFLVGDGTDAENMLNTISEHALAIEALEEAVGDAEGGLVKDAADAKADIADLQADVVVLQDVVDGYTTKGSIKTAVDAAAELAQQGVDAASAAQGTADSALTAGQDAQTRVGTLEGIVGNAESGLVADVAGNTADIADLVSRMDTAEGEIDTLQAIVDSGENKTIRDDVTELQGIVKTGADANATLRSDLSALEGVVEHETTGLAATKAIADQNKLDVADHNGRIVAIEGDYLKMADLFIIDCGTSTVNVYERPQA